MQASENPASFQAHLSALQAELAATTAADPRISVNEESRFEADPHAAGAIEFDVVSPSFELQEIEGQIGEQQNASWTNGQQQQPVPSDVSTAGWAGQGLNMRGSTVGHTNPLWSEGEEGLFSGPDAAYEAPGPAEGARAPGESTPHPLTLPQTADSPSGTAHTAAGVLPLMTPAMSAALSDAVPMPASLKPINHRSMSGHAAIPAAAAPLSALPGTRHGLASGAGRPAQRDPTFAALQGASQLLQVHAKHQTLAEVGQEDDHVQVSQSGSLFGMGAGGR